MVENGIRQLGLPKIGHSADKLKSAWQRYIDLLYLEAVRRGKFDPFVSTLEAPVGNRDEDVDDERPQKSLSRVSGIDSVGERARK